MIHKALAAIGVVVLLLTGCAAHEEKEIRASDTFQNMSWNWHDFSADRREWLCDKFEHDRHFLVNIFDDEGIPPEVTELFFTDVC